MTKVMSVDDGKPLYFDLTFCRDCKHWDKETKAVIGGRCWCVPLAEFTPGKGFCYHGKKKEVVNESTD